MKAPRPHSAEPREKPAWRRVAERFDALTLRERALVVASALAVLWLAWDWTLGARQRRDELTLERDVAQLKARVVDEARKQERLREARANDPNAALAARRDALQHDIDDLDHRLEADLGHFVPPTQAAALLADVVRRHRGVTLDHVEALPAVPVVLKEGESTHLYRHGLRVALTGGYFDVAAYLEDLESSQWQFGWRALDYRVADYPLAHVTVEIETLSHDPNWLGV